MRNLLYLTVSYTILQCILPVKEHFFYTNLIKVYYFNVDKICGISIEIMTYAENKHNYNFSLWEVHLHSKLLNNAVSSISITYDKL